MGFVGFGLQLKLSSMMRHDFVIIGELVCVCVFEEFNQNERIDEEVVAILKEAENGGAVERVNLFDRQLRLIPESIMACLCSISLKTMFLPDSIGLLRNPKFLNVSANKVKALPESIALAVDVYFSVLFPIFSSLQFFSALPIWSAAENLICLCCSSLVEIDASFNNLLSLPINIGYGLVNLERLSMQLNKTHLLPPSICEMKSLRFLDVHFNELRGLPQAIGRLTNIEVLNLSSNFSDLEELPEEIVRPDPSLRGNERGN
uniref:Uncharacterized protein n=1 Tax=Salix viminalis TaxID=40686 RepID=A0A6N2LGA8_SALVM